MRANYDVIMLVMNGIESDSRVIRTARTVAESGLSVLLIGLRKDAAAIPSSLRGEPFHVTFVPTPALPAAEPDTPAQEERHRTLLRHYEDRVTELVGTMTPRVIHSHDMTTIAAGARLKAHFAAEGRSVPWIHDLHEWVGGLTTIPQPILRVSEADEAAHIASVDVLTTVSPPIARIVAEQYHLATEPTVVLNTPALSEYRDGDEPTVRSAIGLAQDVPLLVYSGQVKQARGVHDLVSLLNADPEVHVAIVSNNRGAYVDALVAQASADRTIDRLHLLPYVEQGRVASYLRTADAGVHPLARYGNGDVALPNKLFEYVHAALPVVVSDCAAMAAFVDEHGVGVSYRSGDVASLAAAVRTVLDDRERFAAASRAIKARYSWEEQEKGLRSIYAEVLGLGSISVKPPVAWPRYPIGPRAATVAPLRVLHGVAGSANQPWTLAAALRARGHHAHNVVTALPRLGFKASALVPIGRMTAAQQFALIRAMADEFDVFHFHARSLLLEPRTFRFPTLVDLLLLRLLGKVVVFHFRGSEARLASEFAAANPFHYAEEDPYGISALYPEEVQRRMIAYISSIANAVFVTDPEMQGYVPGAEIVPRAIDLETWQPAPHSEREAPLIVHAPTRPALKGTHHLVNALERMRARGLRFEYAQATDVGHDEVRELYRRADIIVDQLLIGWYGVLAVEGMALAKPVVSYVRPDLVSHIGEPPPLVVADPGSVEDVLVRLLGDASERQRVGAAGRQYVERAHGADVIAEQLEGRYRELLDEAPERGADYEGVAAFFELQAQVAATTVGSVGRANRILERTQALLAEVAPHARRLRHATAGAAADDADARAVHATVTTGIKQLAAAQLELDAALGRSRRAVPGPADPDQVGPEDASADRSEAEPAEAAPTDASPDAPDGDGTAPAPAHPFLLRRSSDLAGLLSDEGETGTSLRSFASGVTTWEELGAKVVGDPLAGLRLLDGLARSPAADGELVLATVASHAASALQRRGDALVLPREPASGTAPDPGLHVRFARHFYNLRQVLGGAAEQVSAALLRAVLAHDQASRPLEPAEVMRAVGGPEGKLNDLCWFFINSAATSRTLDPVWRARYDAAMRHFALRTGLWEVEAFATTRSVLLTTLPMRLEAEAADERSRPPSLRVQATGRGVTISTARRFHRLTGRSIGLESSLTTTLDGGAGVRLAVSAEAPTRCRVMVPEFAFDPERSAPRTTGWRMARTLDVDARGVPFTLELSHEYLAQTGSLTTFQRERGELHSPTLDRQIEQLETLARVHSEPAFSERARRWRGFRDRWATAEPPRVASRA